MRMLSMDGRPRHESLQTRFAWRRERRAVPALRCPGGECRCAVADGQRCCRAGTARRLCWSKDTGAQQSAATGSASGFVQKRNS